VTSTFMRGLALLEVIDRHGPITVTQLARRTGIDVGTVSRTVTACAADGWVVKTGRGVLLGPRAALLGRAGHGADVITAAEPLVHTIAGITGLTTHAYGLVGASVVLLAFADGRSEQVMLGEAVPGLLNVTAAGRAVAAQLEPADLDALLPPEPFPNQADFIESTRDLIDAPLIGRLFDEHRPSRPSPVPTTRPELDRQLEQIRATGAAYDHGDLHPAVACIAVPWPHPTLPAALACLGHPARVDATEPMVLRCLAAAVAPAATPHDVIAAAADIAAPAG
jgi:IclR family transcriptional regulator, acetate operon repressor